MWKYWLYDKKEQLQIWVAWHIPKWLVKWAAVRLGAMQPLVNIQTP